MIHAKSGFTLIECLIYCALLGMLSIVVAQFFIGNYKQVKAYTKNSEQLIMINAAYDLLRSDVQLASILIRDWQVIEKGFICRSHNQCIGWQCKEDRLYRVTGIFDFNLHQWQDPTSALMAIGIQEFNVDLLKKESRILGVDISIQSGNCRLLQAKVPLLAGMVQ